MRGLLSVTLMAGALTIGGAGVAMAAAPVSLSPDEIIAERQAGFDLMQGVAAAMKAAVDAGQPVKPLAPAAKGLVAWTKVIPSAFPAGTETGHDTKAKPEIWSDAAGFAKAAANAQAAAEKLVTLAGADDKAGFAEQFDAVGKTCGACHRAYRVRRD
jgi:cytochrome c556